MVQVIEIVIEGYEGGEGGFYFNKYKKQCLWKKKDYIFKNMSI